MRSYIFNAALLFSIFLSSCNNPLGKTYSAATYNEDMQVIMQSEKINNADVDVLTKFIALSKVAGNDLQGRTYDEILDKIKEIQKVNGDNTSEIKIEQEAKRIRLSSILSVKLDNKEFSKINGKDCFTYTVLFQNKSQQNIKMVIGDICLNDVLEREIKKINIVLDEELKANSTLKKTYIITYNNSDENDKRIRTKKLSDLKVDWNPEKIILENGYVKD